MFSVRLTKGSLGSEDLWGWPFSETVWFLFVVSRKPKGTAQGAQPGEHLEKISSMANPG